MSARSKARKRALEQFRWFTGGWKTMAELPTHAHFDAASKAVRGSWEYEAARVISANISSTVHVSRPAIATTCWATTSSGLRG